jgi:hypothetical protein
MTIKELPEPTPPLQLISDYGIVPALLQTYKKQINQQVERINEINLLVGEYSELLDVSIRPEEFSRIFPLLKEHAFRLTQLVGELEGQYKMYGLFQRQIIKSLDNFDNLNK